MSALQGAAESGGAPLSACLTRRQGSVACGDHQRIQTDIRIIAQPSIIRCAVIACKYNLR
jgi:hypothetical protein